MLNKPIKVLFIEDDRDEAQLVKLLLENSGGDDLVVEWEESLGGGIKRLKTGDFDLVLLDLSLPDSYGFETFRQVRAEASYLPIIVLTGLSNKSIVNFVLEAGARDYLVKGRDGGDALRRSVRYEIGRRRADDALRRSEELYRMLVDASRDSISMLDLEGRFTRVSNKTLEMNGYDSEDELIGESAFIMIAPEQHAVALRHLQETLIYGVSESIVYELLRRDGTSFEGEMSVFPMKDEYGHPRAFMTVVRDVTGEKHRNRVIRRLSMQVITEYERARTMIANDIHDSVGQSLMTLKMELDAFRKSEFGDPGKDGNGKLDRIDSTLRAIVSEVRRLASELRPPLLGDFGFARALEAYVGEFSLATGIPISFSSEGDHSPMEDEKAVLLFRIAQEALANVRKHSHATMAQVYLESVNGDSKLSVRDDGDGFDAENTPLGGGDGMRFGILGMRDRAEVLGGVLDIASDPGYGTTVTVIVPRGQ